LAKDSFIQSIVVASDGNEALSILRRDQRDSALGFPYFVLLDLHMPRMNGLEFLSALRADSGLSRTVVFVLTTSGHHEDIAAAYRQHVAGYLQKSKMGARHDKLAMLLKSYAETVTLPNSIHIH